MKTANRTTPTDRNRAVARLRSLTMGTALASLAAVGAFGTVAAVSWSGQSSTQTAEVVTATPDGNSTTTTATATPAIKAAATPATTTTSKARVTSGGS